MQEDPCTAAELEAVQNWPCAVESETSSERNDRQEREADYIGSPETIQGDNGEEDDEYMARRTAMKKTRMKARLRKWQKRKAQSQAEVGQKGRA